MSAPNAYRDFVHGLTSKPAASPPKRTEQPKVQTRRTGSTALSVCPAAVYAQRREQLRIAALQDADAMPAH
jgi:hypothetical protein